MPLLETLAVADVMAPPRLVLTGHDTALAAAERLAALRLPGAPVVDERDAFIGLVQRDRLTRDAQGDVGVGRLADPAAPTTIDTDHLESALESLLSTRASWIPVLDRDRHVIGILTISDIVRGYREGLRTQLRQVSKLTPSTVALEREIASDSPLAGKTLRTAGLPPGTIVMTIQRDTEILPSQADTVLAAGDRLGILTRTQDAEHVARLVSPGAAADAVPGDPEL
ncbi:MAG: TrkA C-terminal domain-containing protein [Solirubrobacteraceae bacterium]